MSLRFLEGDAQIGKPSRILHNSGSQTERLSSRLFAQGTPGFLDCCPSPARRGSRLIPAAASEHQHRNRWPKLLPQRIGGPHRAGRANGLPLLLRSFHNRRCLWAVLTGATTAGRARSVTLFCLILRAFLLPCGCADRRDRNQRILHLCLASRSTGDTRRHACWGLPVVP